MNKIITDVSQLREVVPPVVLMTESGISNEECNDLIKQITDVMEADTSIPALAGPQVGVDYKIICVRFNDQIKVFLNPIITKKLNYKIGVETCVSMPNKEILISRPTEIEVKYYTPGQGGFVYEDNKLLDVAARLFDQLDNMLEGVMPDALGLVSDIIENGSLADATEEEYKEAIDFYQNQFIPARTAAIKADVEKDEELNAAYVRMNFIEKMTRGEASIVYDEQEAKDIDSEIKQQDAMRKATKLAVGQMKNQAKKANFEAFIRKVTK